MTRTLRVGAFLLTTSLLAACSTQRTVTISSEPVGATVWIDGEKRGTTPVTVPFVYYGDVDVRVEKEGYETIATVLTVPSRIDGYPVVDLPFELTVRRRHFAWTATMRRLGRRPTDAEVAALVERAAAFREKTRREARPEVIRRDLQSEPETDPTKPPPVVRSTRCGP